MKKVFEVWFYIGVVLTTYGGMLTAAGIYQWIHLPPTVLANQHPTFWAGIVLLAVGGAYVCTYWPSRQAGSTSK